MQPGAAPRETPSKVGNEVPVASDDIPGLLKAAGERAIDVTVVGPEAPLVDGLTDRLQSAGIKTFGPSRKAAQLEGSKGFTKDLARDFNIPTADQLDKLHAPYFEGIDKYVGALDKKLGKNVVEVDRDAFRKAAAPFHNDGSGGWSQSEYDALVALK